MYSAWGGAMPVTARARVALWPRVKPVTTNSRSFGPARDQDQAEQEGHVVHPGEDVFDART